jgi:transposase-like protein
MINENKKKESILFQLMNLPSHAKINIVCPYCGSDKVGLTRCDIMTTKKNDIDDIGIFSFVCKDCRELWDPPDDLEELEKLKPRKF